jgi:hypothetical protein
MIIFENLKTGETVGYDRKTNGKHFGAMLSAAINSSNMGINADRGQDFGWRLSPEQQALIELWEDDQQMIDKVANYTKVMLDGLSHTEFLMYLVHEQELGYSPEKLETNDLREKERAYEARVEALKNAKPEAMPQFNPEKVKKPTVSKE